MSNRLFYFLAILAAAALIFLGLAPFRDKAPKGSISAGGLGPRVFVIKGADFHRLQAGSDKISVLRSPVGEAARVITARAFALDSDATLGAHFRLAADLERLYGGHKIAVTVEARGLDDDAPVLYVQYSTGSRGASGWKAFPLKLEPASYRFDYDVPSPQTELGVDFLGLRAGSDFLPAEIEIRKVTIELLGG